MPRHTLVNLILAALLIAFGAIAWFRPGIEQPITNFEIINMDFDTIQTLRAEKNGALIYSLAKTNGDWQLVAPRSASANPTAIRQLLEKTKLTSTDRYSANEVDIEELGLVNPFMKFVFDDSELLVGNSEPISQRRYVKFGDWIYLVDGLAIFSLDRDADSFILEQLTEPEPAENN